MSINQRRRASIAKKKGVGTVCTVTNNVRAPGKPKKWMCMTVHMIAVRGCSFLEDVQGSEEKGNN